MALMLARRLRPPITRWVGPVVFRNNQEKSLRELNLHSPPSERPATEAGREYVRVFFTFLLLGLFAGWLELGLVLVSRTVNPHISIDALRTNRHFLWMVPVADVLIFGVIGVAIALLSRFRPGLALERLAIFPSDSFS